MNPLTLGNFMDADEPFSLFSAWLAEAEASEPNDPTAMALATSGLDGLPNVRMVLLKGLDDDGFVFYTNAQSNKGCELAENRQAAALFHWKSLRRQVRLRGGVEMVSDSESDAYFASRPLQSRIGAWASQQSRPLESRYALEKAVASYAAKFGLGEVPRPDYWRGFRIKPVSMEFWKDGAFRLHDRLAFTRNAAFGPWHKERLYP